MKEILIALLLLAMYLALGLLWKANKRLEQDLFFLQRGSWAGICLEYDWFPSAQACIAAISVNNQSLYGSSLICCVRDEITKLQEQLGPQLFDFSSGGGFAVCRTPLGIAFGVQRRKMLEDKIKIA